MSIVVITGSNSGFGKAGTRAFAHHGDTVIAAVRDLDRGRAMRDELAGDGIAVTIRRLDVTEAASFEKFAGDIAAEFGRIDVLVNNAGILRSGSLEDQTEQDLRGVFETNAIAPLLLSKAVLPYMRAQNGGVIIMVSSLSGVAGLPGDVVYTASKFALEGASEALRHEVDRWGIRVALIEPGLYKTGIFPGLENELLPKGYPTDSPYRALIETRLREVYQRLPDAFDPSAVGELMVEIAHSDRAQFRWPADPVAEKVLATMLGQDDAQRDAFLREVSGTDWWSEGETAPPREASR